MTGRDIRPAIICGLEPTLHARHNLAAAPLDAKVEVIAFEPAVVGIAVL